MYATVDCYHHRRHRRDVVIAQLQSAARHVTRQLRDVVADVIVLPSRRSPVRHQQSATDKSGVPAAICERRQAEVADAVSGSATLGRRASWTCPVNAISCLIASLVYQRRRVPLPLVLVTPASSTSIFVFVPRSTGSYRRTCLCVVFPEKFKPQSSGA